tara:strand:- start:684 stop:989 length:306 start_codon:yes stop_codon:yes gene_type:complete
MTLCLRPNDFPHQPPEGYSYEFSVFKQNRKGTIVAIWLCNDSFFNYTSDPVRTIWGFYRGDKKTYHAPINSNKIGEVVDVNQTRSYTAMQLNLNPLEAAFL